ncbi:MAG: hypothetical protein WCD89_02285 [Anaerocolumna sp.]
MKKRYLFLLLLPALVWVILICYAPMTGLYMAFTNYAPSTKGYFHDLLGAPFVGMDWFDYFFRNDFAKIMRNTLTLCHPFMGCPMRRFLNLQPFMARIKRMVLS